MASEFDLIARYFTPARQRSDVALGVGDDAALLNPPAGQQLVMAVDTLVAGVHYPLDTDPHAIGHKALAVNLSDMAAMGAEPAWATLALTLPEADEAWIGSFAEGFFALAQEHGVQLVGGDTTRGPLSVTVQVTGLVPEGQALTRDGANPGDGIFVTGTLGDAGAGLRIRQHALETGEEQAQWLLDRLDYPAPRIGAGKLLRNLASAAIDISDGLTADLGHILAASRVGASLDMDHLPLSRALQGSGLAQEEQRRLALSAGDDYELCFTVSPACEEEMMVHMASISCPCTCIGEVTHELGLRLPGEDKALLQTAGYDHFKGVGSE
jgi:thiamine-monophosphate kinase